ncbi:cytochrome P450 [Hypomontagnella submonticulosa]|nr:cytochrome P450 [Hypomontagnella submonticulosa]
MAFPWRIFSVASLIYAYFIVCTRPQWTKSQFLGAFVAMWSLQTFLYGFWKVILYPFFFSPLIGLPQPKRTSWFMGHFWTIRDQPTGIPQREWNSTIPNDGVIRYLGPFNQERLLITGPKALAEVLVTRNYDFVKPQSVHFFLSRLLGVGILLAEGDEHRFQRKNLMPAFAFRHVKELYSGFWQKGGEVVEAMTKAIIADAQKERSGQDPEKAKKTAVIDVINWASRATLDIVGQSGLGQDFGAIKNPNNELSKTYSRVFSPSSRAQALALLGVFLPDWVVSRLPVQRNADIAEAAQTIRGVCRKLIRAKKEKMDRKEPIDRDILSVALESGAFTEDNLIDQLMTFLAAGHETTATAMTWAVYMLAKNPEMQKRLRAEIREKLPTLDSDRDISSLDIDHMPYLNAVCNEVLRYYAPVPLTPREAAVDTTIMGRKVPKGTAIMLVPWVTNLDERLWGPDAHEFNPDRWIAKGPDDKKAAAGGASSNYALMTFLHGPRSCIGIAFARAEFACLLATWMGRFEFELANEEDYDEKSMLIKGGVTARPANGLQVHATIVDGW